MMSKKSKHYTPAEKSLFLQVLNKYKHVVECKKSCSLSLREKEMAWRNIAEEFNNSALATHERNVQQLKKFWANLKHQQREILTKERQQRLGTGGGPSVTLPEVDAEVAAISPHLMTTAPVIFTSNIPTRVACGNTAAEELSIDGAMAECMSPISAEPTIIMEPTTSTQPTTNIQSITSIQPTTRIQPTTSMQVATPQMHTPTEQDLKITRLLNIVEHEKRMWKIQEEHEIKMNKLKEEHMAELYKVQLAEAQAKTDLAQLILRQHQNK